jgi:hypothetical protein
MKNTTLTNSLLKTNPSHGKRRVMGRQRRTPKNGAISKKSPGTTMMNVIQKIHWWPRSKYKEMNPNSESNYENTGKRQIIDADPTVIFGTTTIQPEEPIDLEEGSTFFIHICG